MTGPTVAELPDGRIHLHHGPIDLLISVDGIGRKTALQAAKYRFESLLSGLAAELDQHRQPLTSSSPIPEDTTARRMYEAAIPFATEHWITPMIAVAGSVADEILEAMKNTDAEIQRAYVNNGGDISLFLTQGQRFSLAVFSPSGKDLGRININDFDGIKGIATSGQGGRSHSFGIADAVTVLGQSAASADVAATLIANMINLPDHTGIRRCPANLLLPESDLGDFEVVTSVPKLSNTDIVHALRRGSALAESMFNNNLIDAAALFLQGQSMLIGNSYFDLPIQLRLK